MNISGDSELQNGSRNDKFLTKHVVIPQERRKRRLLENEKKAISERMAEALRSSNARVLSD